MKILIIKFRNLGDVLLVSPLIQNIKDQVKDSTIDIAINDFTFPILENNPNLRNIYQYQRKYIKSKNFLRKIFLEVVFIREIVREKYDVVINLTEGDRGALISLFSFSKIRMGYLSKNFLLRKAYTIILPNQEFRHTIDTNLDPLKFLDLSIKDKKVLFYSENWTSNQILKLDNDQPVIHIHPVSRWLFKCISDEIMAEIIDFCSDELGALVVITASSNILELEKVRNILSLCKSKPINLSGKLSLHQVSALNKESKIFIGVDTAIMHISASNNTPSVAFFGPSGADHWGPWDNSMQESHYDCRSGVQNMGIHTVISESRACQPCGKDGCNGSKVSDCLMNIDSQLIFKIITKKFNLVNKK